MPNLSINTCNQRVRTTSKSLQNISIKSEQLKNILENASGRKIVKLKRVANDTNRKAKNIKLRLVSGVLPAQASENVFSTPVADHDEEQLKIEEEPSVNYSSNSNNNFYIVNICENSDNSNQQHSETKTSKEPEPDAIWSNDMEIISTNQGTQTEADSEKNRLVTNEKAVQTDKQQQNVDEDNRFIQIMYPEYAELTKIELIEKITEYQKRIELLENKNEKFQNAIKDLLKNYHSYFFIWLKIG